MSKRHTVTLHHVITLYNDTFDHMDGVLRALAKKNTQWKEDLYFAVKFAGQKLSKYYAEVTPTTGMLLIPAHILDPFRKLRSFRKWDKGSVSNGSSFGPGRFYRSAWQRPYPIKNRRFFKRTITLRSQILIGQFGVWYVKYAALHGASFGCLRLLISWNLSKRQLENLVFKPKITIISKQLAQF